MLKTTLSTKDTFFTNSLFVPEVADHTSTPL
jgi:hypothetical protein